MEKVLIFTDTNVIMESLRTGCWWAICGRYDIVTTKQCMFEVMRYKHQISNIPDLREVLREGLSNYYQPLKAEIKSFLKKYPICRQLDEGEKHLFAWIHAHNLLPASNIRITTADKSAIMAAHKIGWKDNFIALEELAKEAGVCRSRMRAISYNFQNKWLSKVKVKIRMGITP